MSDGREAAPNDGTGRPTRRDLLAAVGAGVAGGAAGCSLLPAGRGIELEWGDGASTCVAPVERDRPVEAFYDYGSANGRAGDRDLWRAGETVTFLYRNATTGAVSLCVVNGTPGGDPYGEGRAVVTFEGIGGTEWRLRDDPPGEGSDTYGSPSGPLGDTETVVWRWPTDGETDGGVVGPLGESFDVRVTHRAAGTVGGRTVGRFGLERWTFVDGADPGTPIEIARFTPGTARSPSIRIATGRC